MLTIIPAIDLKDGRCVRLRQGSAEDAKVYSEDPVAVARRWTAEGAAYLHIVDLDGAFQGRPVHTSVIAEMVKAVSIPVEVGGGLRTEGDIRAALTCGADRAIVGSGALADPALLRDWVRVFDARLAVGIDARDGLVQVKGWVETTGVKALDLAARVDAMGIRTLICTDTARDGMMRGVNTASLDEICRGVKCNVIASGGISSVGDVKALAGLRRGNLVGAIVGKALYEGRVSLAALREAADRPC